MAYDDDEYVAKAILKLCDALDDGGTDSVVRIEAVEEARRLANIVLNRGKKKEEDDG